MKKRTRIGALLMAVVMIFSLTTVSFAEAGQWDPLTDPDTVKGSLYDYKTSYASTQFERGKPGALRMMPLTLRVAMFITPVLTVVQRLHLTIQMWSR